MPNFPQFPRLLGLTDDLSHTDMVNLMAYMIANGSTSFRTIKKWRRDNGKPVDMLLD